MGGEQLKRKETAMSYKKQTFTKRSERFPKCVECHKKFVAEAGDESNTCPECVEVLLQPCKPSPMMEVA
jgi:DNA-directed RNA polymerase subunit RPC12/RpoP